MRYNSTVRLSRAQEHRRMSESSIQPPPGIATAPAPIPPQIVLPGGTTPRSALLIVFLVVFIDLLGFGIVLPMLPLYGDRYLGELFPRRKVTDETIVLLRSDGVPEPVLSRLELIRNQEFDTPIHLHIVLGNIDSRRHGGAEVLEYERLISRHSQESRQAVGAILGVLMSSFSLMQFIFAPIWGRISDRVGRRPILLIGLAGSVVFYGLFGIASGLSAEEAALPAVVLLFVARIGAGIAGATISTAQAVIADCTAPEKRRHGMALIGAAFGIGFAFGPLIGAGALKLFPQQYELTGYTAAGLSLVAFILGVRLLPETRRFGEAGTQRRWLDFGALRSALGRPLVGPVILTFFLATLGFGAFEVTLAMMNRDLLGLKEDQNYLMFAYVGFILMVAQGLIYRRLAKRVTETTFMLVGLLFMGGGVAGLGAVNWMHVNGTKEFGTLLTLMMTGMTLAVMGFAFLTPSAQSLVSRGTSADKQGEILGVNQSAAAMARILGPIFGLSLYTATPEHLLPYGLGAALLLAMLPILPRIRRQANLLAAVEPAPSAGH
jgi:MFS family permease